MTTAFSSAAARRTSRSATPHRPPPTLAVATTRLPSRTYPVRARAGERVNAPEAVGTAPPAVSPTHSASAASTVIRPSARPETTRSVMSTG